MPNCRAALLDLGVRIGQHALVDMADPAGRWSELTALEAGQHVHLDRLMSKSPAPGSSDWIPVVEQVAAFLRRGPGHWMVSLLIGEADRVPTTPTSPEVARSWVARPEEFEPPAVYRLIGPVSRPVDDDDYFRAWDELRPDGINEIVSFSRSASAREAGEGWTVRIGLRIDG